MDPLARRTIVITAGSTVLAAGILWAVSGWDAAIGALAGGALATGNFALLVRDVDRLTGLTEPKGIRAFSIRFLLMGVALFGMIALLKLSPVGVIIGISMILPGVAIGTLLEWKS